jgi:hypothetical protein
MLPPLPGTLPEMSTEAWLRIRDSEGGGWHPAGH